MRFFISSIILLVAICFSAQAQTETKVVIVKKVTIDGEQTVEEITLEGEEAQNFDMEKYLEGISGDNVDVQVHIEKSSTEIVNEKEAKKRIKIIRIDEEGEGNMKIDKDIKIIKDGEALDLDEIQKKLDGLDLDFNLEDLEKKGDLKILRLGENDEEFEIDGNGDMDIFFYGEDELPEDIEKILEEKGIDIDLNGLKMNWTEDGKEEPFLGVWSSTKGDDRGVLLGGVSEDSPASVGGLKEGDVITRFNNVEVKTFQDLAKAIKAAGVDQVVDVEYIRNGQTQNSQVTIGKRSIKKKMKFSSEYPGMSKEERFMRGESWPCCAEMETVEKPMLGVTISNSEKGAIVEELNRNDLKNLKSGDIIYEIEGRQITDIDKMVEVIQTFKPGDKVKVKFYRGQKKKKSKEILISKKIKMCPKDCCKPKDCCASGTKKETKSIRKIIITTDKDGQGEVKREIKTDLGEGVLQLQEIDLYPNPTEGNFKLNFTTENRGAVSISVTDASGKEIIRDDVRDFNGKYNGEFNLEGGAGVYFINISQNGKVFTEKIILKK